MRRISITTAALILITCAPSFGDEWIQFVGQTDFFAVNFPRDPRVQEMSYPSEFGISLPAHVYSTENGAERYSITVVDYADAEKLHTARADQCRKAGGEGDACQNDWRSDVQGAIVYASWKFFQRNAKVTHFGWSVVDQ